MSGKFMHSTSVTTIVPSGAWYPRATTGRRTSSLERTCGSLPVRTLGFNSLLMGCSRRSLSSVVRPILRQHFTRMHTERPAQFVERQRADVSAVFDLRAVAFAHARQLGQRRQSDSGFQSGRFDVRTEGAEHQFVVTMQRPNPTVQRITPRTALKSCWKFVHRFYAPRPLLECGRHVFSHSKMVWPSRS